MRKKLFIMFMTVCMTASLAACGNSGENKESYAETTVEEEAENGNLEIGTTDAVEEESAEQSDSGDIQKESESQEQSELSEPSRQQEQNESQVQKETEEQLEPERELTVDAEYAGLSESKGFEFESNGDGTCTLTEIGTCTDENIVIPEKSPAGDSVTLIGEYAFYGAEDISSIVIAGKTMELDKKAFQSCEAEKLVITGCDLVIGENAFSYCEDIGEVYISNSILETNSYAFYDTGKDMSVTILNCTGNLDDKAFQSCDIVSLTIQDSTLELGKSVFSYCEDLVEITFNNSGIDMDEYAFYDCGDDTIVTMTDCELNMEDKAFQTCGLISLTIEGGETVMGDSTFSYCEELTDIVIGAGNLELGSYCFYECTSLVNVSIAERSEDDSLEIILDDNAFQSCSAKNVVIGRGNIELGDSVFSYCENLVNVEIKGVLTDIGDYAFYDCPAELVISYSGGNYNKESIEDAK